MSGKLYKEHYLYARVCTAIDEIAAARDFLNESREQDVEGISELVLFNHVEAYLREFRADLDARRAGRALHPTADYEHTFTELETEP